MFDFLLLSDGADDANCWVAANDNFVVEAGAWITRESEENLRTCENMV